MLPAELTTIAAFRGLMNRFMDSLQIELEGPEMQARGGRATASPEDLHAYLENYRSEVEAAAHPIRKIEVDPEWRGGNPLSSRKEDG